MDTHHVFEIPRLRTLARHTVPHLLEATFVPLALFYLSMWLVGVWGALVVALIWSYGALLRRVVKGQRIPGILAIGATLMTVRTLIALLSGSVYLYFLQPTLGTIAVAGAFLFSVPAGRPLAERLAADFCPLPESLMARPHMRRFFARISLLWALTYLTNATLTLWLLFSQSLSTYLLVKSFLSLAVTGTAIAASTLWFKHWMRRHGVTVKMAGRSSGDATELVPAPAAA